MNWRACLKIGGALLVIYLLAQPKKKTTGSFDVLLGEPMVSPSLGSDAKIVPGGQDYYTPHVDEDD